MADETLQRLSTLGIKLELIAITGTSISSTGTAVTGVGTAFDTELAIGDVIGTEAEGYRRVTAIASATALTVKSAFKTDLSAVTGLRYAFGEDPTLTSADILEFTEDGTDTPTYKPNLLTRDVVSNSFTEEDEIIGAELEAGGGVGIELHGSGTAGTAPESDALWQAAIGDKNISTASTTHAATPCTVTTLELVASGADGFEVGDAVLVLVSGSYEVAWITAIATDELTVSPAFSGVPGVSVAVGAGVHYKTSKTELKSFRQEFWMGDKEKRVARGCKVSQLALEFNTGELVKPKFTFMSQNTVAPVAEAYGLGTPSFDDTDPSVGKNMTIRFAGTTYDLGTLSLAVENAVYKNKALTTDGISSMKRTGRKVSGSFSMLYEDTSVEVAFRAGTKYEMVVMVGDTPGEIFAMRIPKGRYIETSTPIEDGIYKNDVSFKAGKDGALGDDEITSMSWL